MSPLITSVWHGGIMVNHCHATILLQLPMVLIVLVVLNYFEATFKNHNDFDLI